MTNFGKRISWKLIGDCQKQECQAISQIYCKVNILEDTGEAYNNIRIFREDTCDVYNITPGLAEIDFQASEREHPGEGKRKKLTRHGEIHRRRGANKKESLRSAAPGKTFFQE